MSIDEVTYRRAIADDAQAIVHVAHDLDAPVPSCPGWAVRDLLRHLGKVQQWAAACLRAEPGVASSRPRGPSEGDDPRAWFQAGADDLVATLARTNLTDPVHTWAGEQPGSWWLRRLAHETAIHHWDAEAAAGSTIELAPRLAADGLAEYFDEFVSRFVDQAKIGESSASLHLHATDLDERADAPGEWYVEFGPAGIEVEATHRKGDAAVRASASDLFLLAWRRIALDGLDVVGDARVVERWQQLVVV